ncbi:MAG: MmcQ/YjbR family DNA-binding protein [Mycobacteriales bacterium]
MALTVHDARSMALSLPNVTEQDHHGMASFRIRGKIFATVPDDQHLRVMVDEDEIRAAVSENPNVFHEFYWGTRLACLVVDLAGASAQQVRELLNEAWLGKAPAVLARQFHFGA